MRVAAAFMEESASGIKREVWCLLCANQIVYRVLVQVPAKHFSIIPFQLQLRAED